MGSEVTITIKGVDDFSKVADKITERLEKLSGALGKTFDKAGESAKLARTEIQKIGTEAKKTGDKAKKMGADFGLMVSIFVRGARNLKAVMSSIGDAVSKTAKAIGTGIGQALNEVGGKLATFAKRDLSGNFLSRVVQGTREAISTIVNGATTLIQGGIRAATQLVSGFAKVLGELAGVGATAAGGLVGFLVGQVPGAVFGTIIGDFLGEIPRQIMGMVGGVVEGVGSIFEGITGVIGGVFSAGVNLATAALNNLLSVAQGVVEKIGDVFGQIVGKVGAIFGQIVEKSALVFTGIAGFATHHVLEMEKQIAVAFGLIPDAGEKAFKEMTDKVAALSRKTPFVSGAGLATGLFQAISAGARDPSQAMGILESASQASVAGGLSSVDQTVKALTRTTLLFNKEVGETTDILFQTQNLGQLTFGELASGLGLVLGMAKSANVELMDLMTGIAAGSRGLDPQSLFTGMRRAMQTLASPTPDAAKARGKLGLEFKDYNKEERKQLEVRWKSIQLMEQQIDLYERLPKKTHTQRMMLKDLKIALKGANEGYGDSIKAMGKFVGMMESIERIRSKGLSFEQLREVVPELRAQTFISTVLGLDEKQLADIKTKIKDFSGATQAAFEIQTNTIRGQLSLAWKGLEDIVFDVKEALKPHLVDALKDVNKALSSFAESDTFSKVKDSIVKATIATGEFAVKSMTWLGKNWESIESGARKAYKTVETVALASWTIIKDVWKFGENFFTSQDTDHIRSFFTDAWKIIKELAKGNTKPLTDALNSVWDGFKTKAIETWNEIVDYMVSGVQGLSSALIAKGAPPAFPGGTRRMGPGDRAAAEFGAKAAKEILKEILTVPRILADIFGDEIKDIALDEFKKGIRESGDLLGEFSDRLEKLKGPEGPLGPSGNTGVGGPMYSLHPNMGGIIGEAGRTPIGGPAFSFDPAGGAMAHGAQPTSKEWIVDHMLDRFFSSIEKESEGEAKNRAVDAMLDSFYSGIEDDAPAASVAAQRRMLSFSGGMNRISGAGPSGFGGAGAYVEYQKSLRQKKAFFEPPKANRPLFPTGFDDPLLAGQTSRGTEGQAFRVGEMRKRLGMQGRARAELISERMREEHGIKDIPAAALFKASMMEDPKKGQDFLQKILIKMAKAQEEKGEGDLALGENLSAAIDKMAESMLATAEAQAGLNDATVEKMAEISARLRELSDKIEGCESAISAAGG